MSDTPEDLTAAAGRAAAWCGEPFLDADEDPSSALAPGTARRAALDHALEEMEAGLTEPSLALEGSLRPDARAGASAHRGLPRTAAGTELRRHQVDALAGMLAELIASTQRAADENGNGGNGSGNGAVAEAELDEEADDDFDAGFIDEKELEQGFHGADPGAVRRYRFRHPTASGRRSPQPASSRPRESSES